ncbi:TIGR02444 family protein [Microbulbifer sp. TYP-18]|uniref:TIGR02444 family protein n=1 Tax=Microbulbifer sp. TYP-18 TaxID=3230024 RepID=UPI0034C69DE1
MTNGAPPSSSNLRQNPLWRFSLKFYRHPQVERFLLECQDLHGADVCLMLWASHVAATGGKLSGESWEAANRGAAPLRRVIRRIRQLRRWLGRACPRARRIYAGCKHCEQLLEQRQIAALWTLQTRPWAGDRPPVELVGQRYGLTQSDQALWAGLIDSFTSGN